MFNFLLRYTVLKTSFTYSQKKRIKNFLLIFNTLPMVLSSMDRAVALWPNLKTWFWCIVSVRWFFWRIILKKFLWNSKFLMLQTYNERGWIAWTTIAQKTARLKTTWLGCTVCAFIKNNNKCMNFRAKEYFLQKINLKTNLT
jgi:hypothetical protein